MIYAEPFLILLYWARILVQVTIYRRLGIGRDGDLDQSQAYDISQLVREYGSCRTGAKAVSAYFTSKQMACTAVQTSTCSRSNKVIRTKEGCGV